ncbi:MAG: carotenoid 1,2-hydratase, partial [Pseudomonadota bacterium]|nr:carotenoid 1,2-hydratase [Pseudomonadota bacterium]
RRDGEHHRFMLEFDGAGTLHRHPCPPRHGLKAGLWGVPLTVHGDEGHRPRLRRRYEDTPFYNRSEVETTLKGERLVMVNEGLDLDRFESRWVQSLLPFRMPRRA